MTQPSNFDAVTTAPEPDAADMPRPETHGYDPMQAFRTAPSSDVERPANFGSILRIPVTVQVVLGSASMPVANLMKLGRGAVIPLDHRVGEPVDVVVNGRVVARGEVVVVEDDNSRFGVSLTEIVSPTDAQSDS